jgi:hypothetical protein
MVGNESGSTSRLAGSGVTETRHGAAVSRTPLEPLTCQCGRSRVVAGWAIRAAELRLAGPLSAVRKLMTCSRSTQWRKDLNELSSCGFHGLHAAPTEPDTTIATSRVGRCPPAVQPHLVRRRRRWGHQLRLGGEVMSSLVTRLPLPGATTKVTGVSRGAGPARAGGARRSGRPALTVSGRMP